MSDSSSSKPQSITPNSPSNSPADSTDFDPTQRILRGLTGALMSGTIASALYVTSDNLTVHNLSAAVRTLVVGMVALGTFIFAFSAIGLLLLSAQTALNLLKQRSADS
jgi:hypothetical protein